MAFSSSFSSDDLRPTGIGAFQGDSTYSSLGDQSQPHSKSGSKDSPTASFAADTLEFLEFLSKNSVEIISPEEFTLESVLDDAVKAGSEANSEDIKHATVKPIQPQIRNPAEVELKGANMKILRARLNGEPVALKVFKTTSAPNFGSTASDFVHKFREYTNLMQDIRYEIQIMNLWGQPHRNVVHLLGLSFEEGTASTRLDNQQNNISMDRYLRPILVTELAHKSYPDLRYYLQHPDRPRPLPFDACVRLIGDIADGVHGLHHVGVIHADLKPENILIFPNKDQGIYEGDIVAKVTDFGFSALKIDELSPRGGTRQWNAPECLRSCVDKELCLSSGRATRDIYSFGLVMVHIMLDGGEPLPFHDLEALDELKLQDKARAEALNRLRSYYSHHRKDAEPYELERLEQVIDETLQLFPAKRRQKLDGVRSYLFGRTIYARELDIIRMTVGSRFPALVAIKHVDPLHQIAATVPAIQAAAKKVPLPLRISIFQHYLCQDKADISWITKMRILGLATQEIRHSSVEKTNKTALEIQKLQEIESQLLKEYAQYRDSEQRIRGYLEGLVGGFCELQEDYTGDGKRGFLHDIKLGSFLDRYLIGDKFPESILSLKTKGGWGALHCAAYFDRHDIIRQLLHSGLLVDDRAGIPRYTALHAAAVEGNVASVRVLLEESANPDCISWGELGCSFTPLSLAVLWCRNSERVVEVLKVLTSYGADTLKAMSGRVSLAHIAAGRKTPEVLREVLSHAPALLDARDAYHRTPLHVASEEGRLENVKLLLDLGAKPDLRDYENKTPLDLAENPRVGIDDKRTVPGIESDFGYKLLTRNSRSVVGIDESCAVVYQIKEAVKAKYEDSEEFQNDSQKEEVATGHQEDKSATPSNIHSATTKHYKLRFAVADAVTIPRVQGQLYLEDVLPLEPKYDIRRMGHYLVLEPRYGLRFIYHVMKDIPPLDYQLILRVGRLQHEWNDFQMMLEVFKLPKREILFSHLWQTSHCLRSEQTIYTVKFGEFQLFEMADIEISLSTINIGSKTSPSAGLAFNWIAIEPIMLDVPVYGVLDSTDLGKRRRGRIYRLDEGPTEYSQSDESNADEMMEMRYY